MTLFPDHRELELHTGTLLLTQTDTPRMDQAFHSLSPLNSNVKTRIASELSGYYWFFSPSSKPRETSLAITAPPIKSRSYGAKFSVFLLWSRTHNSSFVWLECFCLQFWKVKGLDWIKAWKVQELCSFIAPFRPQHCPSSSYTFTAQQHNKGLNYPSWLVTKASIHWCSNFLKKQLCTFPAQVSFSSGLLLIHCTILLLGSITTGSLSKTNTMHNSRCFYLFC